MSIDTMIRAPEGVEIDLVIYLVSDSTGLEVAVGVRGLPALLPFEEGVNPIALASKVAGDLALLVSDWRVMTRAEIASYKREHENDEA